MSIHVKLTIILSALLVVSLVIIGVAIFMVQNQQMVAQTKDEMLLQSDSALNSVLKQGKETPPGPGKNPNPLEPPETENPPDFEFMKDKSQVELENMFRDHTRWSTTDIINYLDSSGNLIFNPVQRNSQSIPIDEENIAILKQGKFVWQPTYIDDEPFLVLIRPVSSDDSTITGYIQVARSLAPINQFAETLIKSTGVIAAFEIIICALIGWFVSGVALRRISDITETATGIREEQDFSKRVDYVGPMDEIGKLAASFNAMLENIQMTYDRLTESLQQQRNFVADVSHELRTPLTTIRGNLALLDPKKNISQEEKTEIINDMTQEADRLTSLVNDLLTLARADIEEKMVLRQIELRPIIDEAHRQLSVLDPSREVVITVPEGFAFPSDKTKIKQLLIILIDNAYKHSNTPIEITAVQTETDILISVIDHGPGISAEELPTIFDRFKRNSKNKRDTNGFGLGLSIAKSIAKSIGGALIVESKPNVKTSFTIDINKEKITKASEAMD